MSVRRAAMLFSGGPAPAANAVLNAGVMSLRRAGVEVIGVRDGYTALMRFDGAQLSDDAWFRFEDHHLQGLRNERGVLIGTARAHPGRGVESVADLSDPVKSAGLRTTLAALAHLGVDALVSIGGDGTLRTAAMLAALQRVDPTVPRVRIVHLPKTIDNDYRGIDFTFGFFTAVDTVASELLNLRADAKATSSCYVVECMGRRAGWLAYAAAVAGEAHLVVGVEDVSGPLRTVDGWLDVPGLVSRIVDVIAAREAKGKRYALVVLAEGLVELLPPTHREGLQGDRSGPWGMGSLQIGRLVAAAVASAFEERFGRPKKVTGLQIGYETRCAQPHAFDVLLGCQLGVGASRALTELELDAVMVSTSGQLDLRYVPFDEIVDPATFRTEVRYVGLDSDFRRMVQMLGTRVPTARKVEP